MKMIALMISLIVFNFNLSAQDIKLDLQEDQKHCVAWKANKVMFLVRSLQPVGISCEIEARLVKKEGSSFALQVEVPLSSFDSQEEERDKEVVLILGGDVQPNLILESQAFANKSEYEKFWSSEGSKMPVSLKFANQEKDIEIEFQAVENGAQVEGLSRTSFTAIGVKRPKVAGGAVANVKDNLELQFRLERKNVNEKI